MDQRRFAGTGLAHDVYVVVPIRAFHVESPPLTAEVGPGDRGDSVSVLDRFYAVSVRTVPLLKSHDKFSPTGTPSTSRVEALPFPVDSPGLSEPEFYVLWKQMSPFWQELVKLLGGFAVLASVLGWLMKNIISQFLSKDLDPLLARAWPSEDCHKGARNLTTFQLGG